MNDGNKVIFKLILNSSITHAWGGATIVQGAFVQGDSCPRRQLSKGQFSKETFVQGDFSPRRPLSKKTLIQGGL